MAIQINHLSSSKIKNMFKFPLFSELTNHFMYCEFPSSSITVNVHNFIFNMCYVLNFHHTLIIVRVNRSSPVLRNLFQRTRYWNHWFQLLHWVISHCSSYILHIPTHWVPNSVKFYIFMNILHYIAYSIMDKSRLFL